MKKRIVVIITAVAATAIAAAGVGIYSRHLGDGAVAAVNVSQLSSGEQYLAELNYEKAIAAFEHVIEVEPNNAAAYLAMAKVYCCMGDIDTAQEMLESGYEITNSNVIGRELVELSRGQEVTMNFPETSDFTVIEIAGRSYPANIKELVLRDCGLTNMELEKISDFKELERLDISGNQISDIRVVGKLTGLKKFYAAHNAIVDLSPLAGLTSLEYVGLRDNQITDAAPLFSLDSLKYLHLSENQITLVESLGDNLQLLYLANNQLDKGDIAKVKNAKLLYYDISGNAGM